MSLSFHSLLAIALCCVIAPYSAHAADDVSRLPVREVTVFKDGHAFVLQEGQMPVTTAGTVTLGELPTPILGTFWPYSGDKANPLRSVTASQLPTTIARDAISIRELLMTNPGAPVRLREMTSTAPAYEATVLAVRGDNLVLLKTQEGVRLVIISNIAELALLTEKPNLTVKDVSTLSRLTLTFDHRPSGSNTSVGLMYLQKGIRWIPSYKVVLDGNGTARIALQATLINELTDLDDVTMHLVIGVPNFDFKDTTDPISLQETVTQLSPYFRESRSNFGLSNAIMSQGGGEGGRQAYQTTAADTAPPTVSGSESHEDLFVFSLKNVRLKRGERMVIPVTEFTLPYSDVYKLELPPLPPQDWRNSYYNGSNSGLSPQVAALLANPKVQHVIRLKNTSAYPLTTSPALLLSGDRLLGQGAMTYTSKGGETDLPITSAINITVQRTDKETKRTPDAFAFNDYHFERVDLTGNICLTNYTTKSAALEVTRYVLGSVTEVSNGGTADTLDLFTNMTSIPEWWSSYNWPNDLGRVNGLGRAIWKTTVPAGKSVDLTYSWKYLWR